MIVILDQSTKKLSLYSGNIKVCGVHFSYSPSVQLAHISQEIATLHIGQAHDMFSRIFQIRIYKFLSNYRLFFRDRLRNFLHNFTWIVL
jgi:hypothetical protein